jgi:asparagine synthase (glutamine-hydrolysing)
VASEVKPILAHPAITVRPNSDMLAAALLACFGEERQGWTFFDGVSSVLPGQLVTVTPRAITKRTYWNLGNPEPIRLSKLEEYTEAFREQFERAVARRLRSAFPVAIAVSGGVDSSSIYGVAETLRRRGASPCQDVLAVSMEVEGGLSDERLFLEEIERKYDAHIHRVPTKIRYAAGSLRRSFRDLEVPYFRGGLDSAYPFQRAVRALDARVVLTGQWGDQMLAGMAYLVDFIGQLRWITAWKHMAEYVKWFGGIRFGEVAAGLLKDLGRYHIPGPIWRSLRNGRRRLSSDRSWYTEEFWERARQAEVIQQFRSPGRSAHQQSIYALVRPMYYQQWLERSNKLTAVNGLEEAFPFFDRDLISFMLAIPGGVACSGGIPKALLRAAMRGILPEAIAGRRWKAQVTQELADSMNREFCSLSRYLACDTLCAKFGFVDESRLKAALPALAPTEGSALDEKIWMLGEIFGLELWLQTFWGTKLDEETELP